MKKTIPVLLIFIAGCTKEKSIEPPKLCGIVYHVTTKEAYIAFSNGTFGMHKPDSVYFLGNKICQ